jgi:hypothetical protein
MENTIIDNIDNIDNIDVINFINVNDINMQQVLLKISKLENRYLEMKKEIRDIKEKFAKIEKTKLIY